VPLGVFAESSPIRQVELPVNSLGSARDPERISAPLKPSIRLNRKDFKLTWNAALETADP
jgi:hypothetical protein